MLTSRIRETSGRQHCSASAGTNQHPLQGTHNPKVAGSRDQKAQIRHFRAAFVCRICPGSVGPSPHEAERWPDCERHVYGTVCEHTSPDLFHNERGGRARLHRHIGVRFENERPSSAKFILSSTPASISGRAGGALGAREDENQQKAMTGNASCPRGCNPCRTRDSARIARCATAIGERGFPPEPPSQGGSVGSNPIGATKDDSSRVASLFAFEGGVSHNAESLARR